MKNAMLAKVHIAKKELGLDDDAYRAVLKRVVGKESAGKCTPRQLVKVLEEFKRLGFRPAFKKAANPQVAKVYALWGELAKRGLVKSKDKKSVRAWVKRMTGKDAPEFLTPADLNYVIEALKKWVDRAPEPETCA